MTILKMREKNWTLPIVHTVNATMVRTNSIATDRINNPHIAPASNGVGTFLEETVIYIQHRIM